MHDYEDKNTLESKTACCSSEKPLAMESCCDTKPETSVKSSCCATDETSRIDWLLWVSSSLIILFYAMNLVYGDSIQLTWAQSMSDSVFSLINTMWWSMVLAAIFVGILGRIPQNFVISALGNGGTWRGLYRATLAGLLLDLCSHGILMVGMQLYRRGASLGQVMAFLIASPWNSLSLTLILIALIGLPWTLAFILLSAVIALISGRIFDKLVMQGRLPCNGQNHDLPDDFHFWREARSQLKQIDFTPGLIGTMLWEGIKGSRMVLRWLLFGIVLASAIRTFINLELYQTLFGPTLIGLGMTLIAATIIEVCSEGSTPIAADLMTRARAPGNSFAFLMTGVATDYTEVMSIKDTTRSWKIALFLPLITLPQVIVIGWILNL